MKEEQEEESTVTSITPSVIDPQEAAMIDIQVSTALRYPRNLTLAVKNAIATVQMDDATAHSCKYTVPRGGKNISGPSVHLAKIIAQYWKNLRVDARVIGIDEKHVTSMGVCWDLESNVAIRMEVKRSIIDKKGKRYGDDLITVTGNAANAIAMRNAILNTIPRSVIDQVYKAAERKILGDISTADKLNARIKQAIDKLKDTFNVTEPEILAAIGRQSRDQITQEDILELAGIYQAISDGDTTVDAAFRGGVKEDEISLEDLVKAYQERMDKLDPKIKADAVRILGLEGTVAEKNSFKKLQKELLKIKV